MYPVQNRQSLGEQAYDKIREAIITLTFKPGQMVYETDLANWLGMSRTPIREGIRMLLVEDLIEVLPQRGLRVSLISESKVEDIRFVRESLEVSAFRHVAATWDPDAQLAQALTRKVAQLLHDQRVAASAGDVVQFLYLDEEFHRAVMERANNHTLISVVAQMRGHLNRVRVLSMQGSSSMDTLIDEHGHLFQAVVDGNQTTTVSVLTHHLRRLRQDIAPLKTKFGEYFSE